MEKLERVKKAIETADVELTSGNRRSLGYYAGVGIDHFNHHYAEIYPALIEAAAKAAIAAVEQSTPEKP